MAKKSKPEIVSIDPDHLPTLTPVEIARYNALPEGTPHAESPEMTSAYRAKLERIVSRKVLPHGRPTAGTPCEE